MRPNAGSGPEGSGVRERKRVQPRQVGDSRLRELETSPVPPRALLISLLALAVAAAGNWFWPERLPDYFALFWLLALIPPFLLAYYRGWEGAALALAAGMILLIGVEVGGSYLSDRQVRWWIVGGVILVLIIVCLGAGFTTDRLHRDRTLALELAYEDALTGLPNRRVLDLFLTKEFANARRGAALSIVLFDVDGFKLYNDSQGHSAGDEVLRMVGEVLGGNTRTMDLSGRYGGDEFLALLPGERAIGAVSFAERVRAAVAKAELAREEGITLSGGVAAYDPGIETTDKLIDAADRALYAAKRAGGNRIVVNAEAGDEGELEGEDVLLLAGDGSLQDPGAGDGLAEARPAG